MLKIKNAPKLKMLQNADKFIIINLVNSFQFGDNFNLNSSSVFNNNSSSSSSSKLSSSSSSINKSVVINDIICIGFNLYKLYIDIIEYYYKIDF